MQFTYTPERTALRERASRLTDAIARVRRALRGRERHRCGGKALTHA